MNIVRASRRPTLSMMLACLALHASCIAEGDMDGDDPDAAGITMKARTRPSSDCTKQKFAQAGVTAASAIPYVGLPAAVLSDLFDFTSFFGSCGITIEQVMQVAKKAADDAVIGFAKSELNAIDTLIQSDSAINLAKLEARFTVVAAKTQGLVDLDFATTPTVVAASTVLLTLQMLKLQLAHYYRRAYVAETQQLLATVRGWLKKKEQQFNTYWDKSKIEVKSTFVINPPRVDYFLYGDIIYPDGSRKALPRTRYRSSEAMNAARPGYEAAARTTLANDRRAAYDELFTNAPYKKLLDTLGAVGNEAALRINLGYKRPATQSTTLGSQVAANAVDGKVTATPLASTSPTEANPWWMVDLGRTDEGGDIPLDHFRVYFATGPRVWNVTAELLDNAKRVIWSKSGTSDSGNYYAATGFQRARYVRVRLNNNEKALSLIEVVVVPAYPPAR